MKVVYDNHRQALKVRVLTWVSFVVCALILWGAWHIFQSYGLAAGDGGALRPVGERLAVSFSVAALGLAFAGGMALYSGLYVTRMSADGKRVAIETLSWPSRRTHAFDMSELGRSAYYHGRMKRPVASGGARMFQSIDAPWITVRAKGRRLPFVFDLQAETIDIGGLSVLAEGGVSGWQADT